VHETGYIIRILFRIQ